MPIPPLFWISTPFAAHFHATPLKALCMTTLRGLSRHAKCPNHVRNQLSSFSFLSSLETPPSSQAVRGSSLGNITNACLIEQFPLWEAGPSAAFFLNFSTPLSLRRPGPIHNYALSLRTQEASHANIRMAAEDGGTDGLVVSSCRQCMCYEIATEHLKFASGSSKRSKSYVDKQLNKFMSIFWQYAK